MLFLDEPFSALDFEMTLFIREKLQEVFMQTGTTMMLVSHDLEEAVYLADQVLLLTKRPTRIAEILRYDDPRPRTVATLSEPSFIAHQEAQPRDLPARGAALGLASSRWQRQQLAAYVDAAAAALGLAIAAAHRPRRAPTTSRSPRRWPTCVMRCRSAREAEPAPVFVPIAPDDPGVGDGAARS